MLDAMAEEKDVVSGSKVMIIKGGTEVANGEKETEQVVLMGHRGYLFSEQTANTIEGGTQVGGCTHYRCSQILTLFHEMFKVESDKHCYWRIDS